MNDLGDHMKKPIKVLRVIGPFAAGGVENITMNYFRSVDPSRVRFDFLFHGKKEISLEKEIEERGSHFFKVEHYRDNNVKSMIETYKIIKENNYDIIHSHMNALSVFPLMAAKFAGAKIRIASNHSTASKHEWKRSIVKFVLRPFSKLFATHYVACSKHAAIWLFGEKAFKKGKVKLIKNAIELEKFRFSETIRQETRKEIGCDEKFIIGHVGRFVRQKNHAFLIEVFEDVVKKNENAILVLIGDGPLKSGIEALVVEKGLSRYVKFLGLREDVHRWMQAFDVFLLPSLYEGLGNVITEAQAASTVSIISEGVPEEVKITEFVDQLSLSQSISEWSEQILKYRIGYPRKDTINLMIDNGYEIRAASESLVDYYEELMEVVRKEKT